MIDELKYVDEEDKSYGVAGMCIALYVCDGEQIISEVSVENGEETISFSPAAFFINNPRLSARIVWLEQMKEYQIYSGVLLGNIISRAVIGNFVLTRRNIDIVRNLVSEYGKNACQLDKDEIDTLFEKNLKYFNNLFGHHSISSVVRDLASTLRFQRRLTSSEVFEILGRLSMFN